jgi:hypothetical protein
MLGHACRARTGTKRCWPSRRSDGRGSCWTEWRERDGHRANHISGRARRRGCRAGGPHVRLGQPARPQPGGVGVRPARVRAAGAADRRPPHVGQPARQCRRGLRPRPQRPQRRGRRGRAGSLQRRSDPADRAPLPPRPAGAGVPAGRRPTGRDARPPGHRVARRSHRRPVQAALPPAAHPVPGRGRIRGTSLVAVFGQSRRSAAAGRPASAHSGRPRLRDGSCGSRRRRRRPRHWHRHGDVDRGSSTRRRAPGLRGRARRLSALLRQRRGEIGGRARSGRRRRWRSG